MTKDVLVFCPDTAALVSEVAEKFPERLDLEDPNSPRFLVDKTPTVRNGNETISLVRADDGLLAELQALDSVTVLGTYDEVEADPDLKAVHDRVYPRTERVWTDDEGRERTTIPPERIGAFA